MLNALRHLRLGQLSSTGLDRAPAVVLNALRHLRLGQALANSVSFNSHCAQRLAASKVGAAVARLKYTPAEIVLNALRHLRLGQTGMDVA